MMLHRIAPRFKQLALLSHRLGSAACAKCETDAENFDQSCRAIDPPAY
jgi:hypothetical protein